MLEDRDYMRQAAYYVPRVSFTVVLLIVNAAVFLIECVFAATRLISRKNNYFALSFAGIKHGFVWQLLTFQFMHAGLLHLLFNSWAIYIFFAALSKRGLGRRVFWPSISSAGLLADYWKCSEHLFGRAISEHRWSGHRRGECPWLRHLRFFTLTSRLRCSFTFSQ